MISIVAGGLDDPRVVDLLRRHVQRARAESPPGSSHALDLSGLKTADISFWSAWDGETLLGVGALKRLDASHGEVKSMHTAEAARRRGVGAAMLRHIVEAARADGLGRLSLETGTMEYFQAARDLYRRHGFHDCAPFGDYRLDPASVFMTLELG